MPSLKKFTVGIFLFTITLNIVNAQQYVSFPADSAFWKTKFSDPLLMGLDKTFELTGDTIISTKQYHKIYETSVEVIYAIDSTIFSPTEYIGGIREQDKIVYFTPADSLNEQIIYDFNLGIGDTVAPPVYPCPNYPFTINAIDSVQLADGTFRKRYLMNSCGNATGWYVEGIGNANGPLPFYGVSFGPGSYAPSLSCFTDHGVFLYSQSNSDCSVFTGVEEISGGVSTFSVYPNPVYNYCIIDFGRRVLQGELKIVDEVGRMIIDIPVSNEERQIVSLPTSLNGSIYIVILTSGNEIASGKIVARR